MNTPSPAIVAQNAVRSLPRWIMLCLCTAYVVAGFVGRDAWRDVDVAAFGFMQAMAHGEAAWTHPNLQGISPTAPGLLQYWLGAWSLQLLPSAMPADWVVRLPFMALLVLSLLCVWRAVFHLAMTPGAQPVSFAFGGEASPQDYARAVADGGLLAMLACLGLAQLSHETSHTLVQLCSVTLVFFAATAMGRHTLCSAAAAFAGLLAMSLAGAPTMALVLGLCAIALTLGFFTPKLRHRFTWAAWWGLSVVVAASAAWALGLWEYRLINPWVNGKDWQSLARLLIWFSWPAWPLALWTLWRWRRQLAAARHNPHLVWPLVIAVLGAFATVFTNASDRALVLALPGVAALAAFALPTFRRSWSALIDWLTLFFFTVSAITIWVVWISVQTGIPAKPAENVQRLAIGFEPAFSLLPFLIAVAATVGWLLLVAWRTRRHRAAIWKSLALPAGGTVLGWVLLMTLWLPMLDYGRSYAPHIHATAKHLPVQDSCVQLLGFNAAQTAAVRYYGPWHVQRLSVLSDAPSCQWMLATPEAWSSVGHAQAGAWQLRAQVTRPTERKDHWLVLEHAP